MKIISGYPSVSANSPGLKERQADITMLTVAYSVGRGGEKKPWLERETKSCISEHLWKQNGPKSIWPHFYTLQGRSFLTFRLTNLIKRNYIFMKWCKAKLQALNRKAKDYFTMHINEKYITITRNEFLQIVCCKRYASCFHSLMSSLSVLLTNVLIVCWGQTYSEQQLRYNNKSINRERSRFYSKPLYLNSIAHKVSRTIICI